MAKDVTVWYDREGDSLEVLFERTEGYFRATDTDAVMKKVDPEGRVIGVLILGVSQAAADTPVSVTLREATE